MPIALALTVVAVAARLAMVLAFPEAAYPDSAYYVEVARAIASGRGLHVPFVWSFAEVGGSIPAHPTLPVPSNGHWLPLASFLQVPSILLLGPTPFASALPFALVGALMAPLAWAIARDAGASRFIGVGAGLLAAIPVTLVFQGQPDNVALYGTIGGATLWLAARGIRGDDRAFVAAGLLAGLGALARNDGVLLAVVLGAALVRDRRGARRIPLRAALGAVALFLAVIGPWWLRQLATFGTISPSTASGRAIFIRTMDEWNSIATPATLGHLLAGGPGELVVSRVGGFGAALFVYAALVCGIVLVPFVLVGWWRRQRDPRFAPAVAYGLLLTCFAALVVPAHIPGGMFIHSAIALAPHTAVLAVEGLLAGFGWVAARRPRWDPVRGPRLLTGGVVALVCAIGPAYAPIVRTEWDVALRERRAIAAALAAVGAGPDELLMSTDPAGFHLATGHPGVVMVADPLETNREVATAYGVRWLVLQRRDGVPAMAPVLDGTARPAWIGPPVFALDLDGAPGPDLALYPVCTAARDPRCAALVTAPGAVRIDRSWLP